ncbi:hypothetical protein TVAG_429180 [Trichomonas vaginalis G3]|uniref:Uncharacterized protein n=1 Tax=Trichomonas vaginalis (strain ATCC PRA-98 / G3) TaxID=412133 RepID=A2F937_TRIV3|nr:hypothetical protein TVAGG3_0642050 [Trichomonas vaginalis G3]EAX98565.1 hypothetical protein TVAG_429180 [Trichomonas vaginalis G3]KAI5505243.1 hypothetical protein TVAGG3_0642050 [Trichomonas vaginalis G3]|eukprot:XP_001311495.1 hypothetical protein [Trichomonas vaginalis G3]
MQSESEFLVQAAKDWVSSIFGEDLEMSNVVSIAKYLSLCILEPIEPRFRRKKRLLYLWIGIHFPELRKTFTEKGICINYVSDEKKFSIRFLPPPILQFGNRRI